MDTQNKVEEIILTPEEEKEMREGMAIYEMSQSEGFRILKNWLEELAYHSWMDPRVTKSQEEWAWQELNAYYAANNAKELLERVNRVISDADYLHKVQKGEVSRKGMRI